MLSFRVGDVGRNTNKAEFEAAEGRSLLYISHVGASTQLRPTIAEELPFCQCRHGLMIGGTLPRLLALVRIYRIKQLHHAFCSQSWVHRAPRSCPCDEIVQLSVIIELAH